MVLPWLGLIARAAPELTPGAASRSPAMRSD